MKVGLFFGSFNPVHIGHMAIACYLIEYTDLDQIWFILSPHNPQKQRESLLSFHHRLEMLHLAIGDDSRFKVSDIEAKMPLPSYTIDTLTYLSEKYPEITFGLIIGSDNLRSFHRWKNPEEIINKYTRYVYPRTNCEDVDITDHRNINFVDAPKIEISSTFIRESIANGKDVKYFLPLKVYEYIDKMNFYKK